MPLGSLIKVLVSFAKAVRLENVHPLQAGILRLKTRSERRPGLAREAGWKFWSRYGWETATRNGAFAWAIASLLVTRFAVLRRADVLTYMDEALTPISDDEDETRELLTKTTGASAFVAHTRRVARLSAVGGAPVRVVQGT